MDVAPEAEAERPPPRREQYLKRYREKKRRRLHAKTIRYHKRKVNADNRCRPLPGDRRILRTRLLAACVPGGNRCLLRRDLVCSLLCCV